LLGPSRVGLVWPHDWPVLFPKRTQIVIATARQARLIFLLFQVGMEFDYSHVRSKSKTVTAVSILGIMAPVLCGLAIGPWLHEKFAPETPRFGFQFSLCIALFDLPRLPIHGADFAGDEAGAHGHRRDVHQLGGD